jgi:hypothetical protein
MHVQGVAGFLGTVSNPEGVATARGIIRWTQNSNTSRSTKSSGRPTVDAQEGTKDRKCAFLLKYASEPSPISNYSSSSEESQDSYYIPDNYYSKESRYDLDMFKKK